MFTINYTRIFALPLAALGLVVSLSQPAAANTWQRYSSLAGGYSVQFPGSPERYTRPVTNAFGNLTLFSAAVETADKRTSFLVMYSDFPASDRRTAMQVLTAVRGGLQSGGARITSERATSVDGRPGTVIEGTNQDGYFFVNRCFVDGHRLYQVMYITMDAQISPSANAFLNSFRITR